MLERVDLPKVFSAAQKKGYLHVELYAESRQETQITLQGRQQDTRLNAQEGLSLSLSNGASLQHYSTNQIDTDSLLSLVNEEPPSFTESSACMELSDSFLLREKVQKLKTAMKKSGANLDESVAPFLRYQETVRHFEVCQTPDSIETGKEEKAEAHWQFNLHTKESSRAIHDLFARSSIQCFWEDLTESVMVPDLPKSWFNPWPSPRGPLPVLWKPKAFAQIALPFLRAFEGDLVLKKMSLLHQLEKGAPLHFRVEDLPDLSSSRIDHEGSARAKTNLFEGGMAKTVACDKFVAHHFSIPSTGHARRESFLHPSSIALWSTTLIGNREKKMRVEDFSQGICIDEVQVKEFNPFSGRINLEVTDAYLIHHGEEGEALKPVTLQMSLVELLSSMTEFGEEKNRFGCLIKKQGQDILTEVHVPFAFSPELDYPGEVPPSHYW